MIDRLIRQMQLALSRQWSTRVNDIRRAAREPRVSKLSPTDAFQAGARWAYWQGVSDMAAVEVAVSAEDPGETLFH